MIFCSTSIGANVTSESDVTKTLCKSISLKINKVQGKLRAGYSVSQGEKLKKQMRKIKKQRYYCNKQNLTIN
jgi:hypothetical protein